MVYEFLGLLVESYGTWLLLQRLVDASKDLDIPKNVPFAFERERDTLIRVNISLTSSSKTTHTINLVQCRTNKMVADALTKNLPAPAFEQHRAVMLGEDEAPFTAMMCRCMSYRACVLYPLESKEHAPPCATHWTSHTCRGEWSSGRKLEGFSFSAFGVRVLAVRAWRLIITAQGPCAIATRHVLLNSIAVVAAILPARNRVLKLELRKLGLCAEKDRFLCLFLLLELVDTRCGIR